MFEVDRLTRKYELVLLSGNDVGVFPSNLVTKMVTGTMLTMALRMRTFKIHE